MLVSPSARLLHAEAQKVNYHPYCQRVQRDERKFEKGWEIAQNENLNLASCISIRSDRDGRRLILSYWCFEFLASGFGYVFGYVAGRRLMLFTVPFADFLESLREICEWCADPSHRTIRPLSLAVLILASATTQDDAAAPR